MPTANRANRWVFVREACRVSGMLAAWLVVVGLGTAFFFPPGLSAEQPDRNNVVGFGAPMAIAGALACGTHLGLAGRRRWAVEMFLLVPLAIAISVAFDDFLLRQSPWVVRSRMGYWEFLRLQNHFRVWNREVVRFSLPLAAAVGALAGIATGLVRIVARYRPRAAFWLVVAMLVACALPPVQQKIFDLVLYWGLLVRFTIDSHGMTDTHISASGAILGAVAGTLAALVVLRGPRRKARPSNQPIPAAL